MVTLEDIRTETVYDPATFNHKTHIGIRMGGTVVFVTLQRGDTKQKVVEALLNLATKVEQC